MLDYHAQVLSLQACSNALATATISDPALASARNELQKALSSAGTGPAMLGALVYALFDHASSDGSELALLDRAAGIWDQGISLFNVLGSVRNQLETSLASPADPGSVAQFNSAAADVQLFAQRAYALQAQVTLLRNDVVSLAYLKPHPRQIDKPASTWDWNSLMLGRRTDAFVRKLNQLAHNTATRAFAFGALSSYGANAAGSAYLGQVVGGPRRSHRFRDRLARYTCGSWLARAHPSTPSPSAIAGMVRFSGSTLPASIHKLLTDAANATFDTSKLKHKVPNLQAGYRRLLDHLELLDRFVLPPIPLPPQGPWLQTIYGDPSTPPGSLRIQDAGFSGDPGGGISYTSGNSSGDPQPGKSDSGGAGTICGIIMAILIIIDVIQAFVQCIVQWAKKEKCTFWDNMLLKKLWEKDPPDPRDPPTSSNISSNSSQLTALATADETPQFLAALFDIHCQVWEALDRAQHFLALHGLIYPGSRIELPVYKQFTSAQFAKWPHRPDADPINSFHLYPTSPLEDPVAASSAYAAGETPDAIFHLGVSRFALPLWEQLARHEADSENLDLDADRGFAHPCWATAGSIDTDPVTVKVLAYADQ